MYVLYVLGWPAVLVAGVSRKSAELEFKDQQESCNKSVRQRGDVWGFSKECRGLDSSTFGIMNS